MARRRSKKPPRLGYDGIEWIVEADDAHKALRKMVRNVNDFRPFWEPIIDAVFEDNAQRFASRDGGTWRPLTPKYAQWKASHGAGKLMQLTGTLLAAMTEKGDRGPSGGWANAGQRITRGRQQLTMRFFAWSGRGKRTNVAVEQTARGRKVLNPNSPFLRKRMGDAAGEVAKKWAREWEAG